MIANSKSHLYADDLAIYIESYPNRILESIEKINADVQRINEWIQSRGMGLNPEKTQPIIIGSKYNTEKLNAFHGELPRIHIDGTEINYVKSVKYLGFNFNSHFTSENQINAITKRVNSALSQIRHRRNALNINIKLQLTRGIILPLFDYAAIIYHGFGIHGTGGDETRINVLMNSCIRFVCNLSGRDHVSAKYIELNLLNAYNRRVMLICCIIHTFIETGTPSYLADIFKINTNGTRAGRDTVSLVVKNIKLSRNEHLLAHCACKLWNEIPADIRNSQTKDVFSTKIKNYLLEQQKQQIDLR